MKTLLTLVMFALPLVAAAQTQTVWRCGADGRSYSDTPCAEGKALQPAAPRPVADVRAAHEAAAREQQLADQMRQGRLRDEAVARQGGPAGFRTTPPGVAADQQSAQFKKKPPPEAAGTWRAAGPASRRAKG